MFSINSKIINDPTNIKQKPFLLNNQEQKIKKPLGSPNGVKNK